MALSINPYDKVYMDDTSPIQEELIQIQGVAWKFERTYQDYDIYSPDQIKIALVHGICEGLLDSKLLSFTKSENHRHGTMTYKVRTILVPDTQVKILRKFNYIK